MSSTAMWLLLAVVVILTGVMAALSFAAYLFFRVPFYGGSSFHLGNTFTALAALLMDGVSGGLAGAIGLSLADILAGDPGYAVTTFVLKFIIGVVCGLVAHRLCRIDTADSTRRLSYLVRVTVSTRRLSYLVRVTVSAASGLLVNVITDPLLGYFRNVYIFGQDYTAAQALAAVAGGVTLANSLVSTVCAVLLYLAVKPALDRAGLLPRRDDKEAHLHQAKKV